MGTPPGRRQVSVGRGEWFVRWKGVFSRCGATPWPRLCFSYHITGLRHLRSYLFRLPRTATCFHRQLQFVRRHCDAECEKRTLATRIPGSSPISGSNPAAIAMTFATRKSSRKSEPNLRSLFAVFLPRTQFGQCHSMWRQEIRTSAQPLMRFHWWAQTTDSHSSSSTT